MGVAVGADPIVTFETHPSRYRRWQLAVDGAVATLRLAVPEDGGLTPGYQLKLNSYDLGVDIELADAVNRLRFEHPQVACVVVTGGTPGVFSSGANIFMLGSSSHNFKVNFCKFTNETRLAIEDATGHSGQTYLAAINGICSGGGYELALACQEIYLIDDRKSAVALPEVPYLGVLPGTGGLTRVVDKRHIPRDRADVFCTLAEGMKGKKAKAWGLVDDIFPSSQFDQAIVGRAREVAGQGHPERRGITLEPLDPELRNDGLRYRYVELVLNDAQRTATLWLRPTEQVAHLRMFRELDDALCRMRFNHPTVGLVQLRSEGNSAAVIKSDQALHQRAESGDWLARETLHFMKRVAKRLDQTARSFFALVDRTSCMVGCLLDLALACDRIYMLAAPEVRIAMSPLNFGWLPMANGLTRLQMRLLADPQAYDRLRELVGESLEAEAAEQHRLVTCAFDDIDWDDEIRLACEERISLSPDALTGMEASLRFAGPETLETKIFGRLSAWQNWIFQRPNAIGPSGALTLYGKPETTQFDWRRT